MKKRIPLIFFIIAFVSNYCPVSAQTPSYLQKQNYEWAFGGRGFNFNNDTLTLLPTTFTGNGASPTSYSLASACDANGKLLLYTDGYGIYEGSPAPGNNNNFIPGAYPILPHTYNVSPGGSTSWDTLYYMPGVDGSVIIPIIDSPGKYYVFTNEQNIDCISCSGIPYYGSCTLYYSVVDMSLNGGHGGVEPGKLAIPVDSNLTDAVEAIVGDDCNIWLLVHDQLNTYKAYSITGAGIDPTPVISTGANTIGLYPNLFYTQVTCSPNRRKLATNGIYGMEISDFDPATGTVSNVITQSMVANSNNYLPIVVFSPDNTKLYISIGNSNNCMGCGFGPNTIIQYDLSSGPGPWPPVVADTTAVKIADLPTTARLGPDGKIYMDDMCVIEYPDSPGTACHVQFFPNNIENGIKSVGFLWGWTLPYNAVPVLPNHDTVIIKQQLASCFVDSAVTMTASDTAGWNYTWNDYNEYRLPTNHRTVDTPGIFVLTYNTPGCQYHIDSFVVGHINYTVNLGPDTAFCNGITPFYVLQPHDSTTGSSYHWQDGSSNNTDTATNTDAYWVTVNDQGCIASDTVQVKFTDLRQHLGNDTTFCAEHPVLMMLQADTVTGADILWSNGSTVPVLQVQDTGIYWITVTDTPCIASDTIQIHAAYCDCAFGMPNAFTPNGDGKNDLFHPVLPAGCRVEGYLLTIYNRWGQEVYSATTESEGWDGTFNGIPADIGTYRYVVQFEAGTENQKRYQKGDVTLIR